jgi:hypothetical protein
MIQSTYEKIRNQIYNGDIGYLRAIVTQNANGIKAVYDDIENKKIQLTMINTFLGRLTLLFILILITSHHTMGGLVSVLLIIALYEHYNRFEGQENMSDSTSIPVPVPTDKPKEEVKPNESGAVSSPASIPSNDPVQPAVSSSGSMDTSKKTELESQIQKGNNSKQLPTGLNSNSANVSPSESTKTSSVASKEGFANTFGNDWAPF